MDVYTAKGMEPVVDTREWKPGKIVGVDLELRRILVKYDHGCRWCDEEDIERTNHSEELIRDQK